MLRGVRQYAGALLGALHAIDERLTGVITALEGAERVDAVEARMASLEGGMARWTAEAEGELLRAHNERKAARAAEERTRYREQRLADIDDDQDGAEVPEDYRRAVAALSGASGSDDGLSSVPGMVGGDRQARRATLNDLRRRKWGL